jgi:hypothetical protein
MDREGTILDIDRNVRPTTASKEAAARLLTMSRKNEAFGSRTFFILI